MTSQTLFLTPSLYEYWLANTLRESPLLTELREETAKLAVGHMQIAPEQGQLLDLLVKLSGANHALEIGVFTGYSSLSIAQALSEQGKLVACDNNAEWTAIAQRYWQRAGVASKIELRLAPALETLQQLLTNKVKFDFIFIDADKANYPAYYELSLQLLCTGGLIVLDNTLWYGKVADSQNQEKITQMMRHVNRTIYQDERVDMILLPLGDGMTLVRKK